MRKLITLAALIFAFTPGPSRAANIYVQAESFVSSNDIAYKAIRSYAGLLDGLDYPDEWAEYRLSVPAYGTYAVRIRCWGDIEPYHLHLVTLPVQGEEPQTIDLTFTGKGSSCT